MGYTQAQAQAQVQAQAQAQAQAQVQAQAQAQAQAHRHVVPKFYFDVYIFVISLIIFKTIWSQKWLPLPDLESI